MTQIPNELTRNFADPAVRRKLMTEYADCRGFQGKNEKDEIVWVSISSDDITVATYQSNGWVRVNYYDENGLAAGEAYNGRWNKPEEKDDVVYVVIENDIENGEVYVEIYKTKEAALDLLNVRKSKHSEDEIVEDDDGLWFSVDGYTCEIKEKVICDV